MTSGTQEVVGWNGLRQRIHRGAALPAPVEEEAAVVSAGDFERESPIAAKISGVAAGEAHRAILHDGTEALATAVSPQHECAMRQDQASGKRVALGQGFPGVATQRAAQQMLLGLAG
ncbi:MAG TPA: hypothetical protein VKI44_04590 [Acetobacteraceae bacterium]|nr:hypothetical protein [Acetobacteraceae bacterium]